MPGGAPLTGPTGYTVVGPASNAPPGMEIKCGLMPSPRPSPTGRGRKEHHTIPSPHRAKKKTAPHYSLSLRAKEKTAPHYSLSHRAKEKTAPHYSLSLRERVRERATSHAGRSPLPYGERARVRGNPAENYNNDSGNVITHSSLSDSGFSSGFTAIVVATA